VSHQKVIHRQNISMNPPVNNFYRLVEEFSAPSIKNLSYYSPPDVTAGSDKCFKTNKTAFTRVKHSLSVSRLRRRSNIGLACSLHQTKRSGIRRARELGSKESKSSSLKSTTVTPIRRIPRVCLVVFTILQVPPNQLSQLPVHVHKPS
jgi:hypothetical protein